jgi:hypothetical protein
MGGGPLQKRIRGCDGGGFREPCQRPRYRQPIPAVRVW